MTNKSAEISYIKSVLVYNKETNVQYRVQFSHFSEEYL